MTADRLDIEDDQSARRDQGKVRRANVDARDETMTRGLARSPRCLRKHGHVDLSRGDANLSLERAFGLEAVRAGKGIDGLIRLGEMEYPVPNAVLATDERSRDVLRRNDSEAPGQFFGSRRRVSGGRAASRERDERSASTRDERSGEERRDPAAEIGQEATLRR
jgi:hypothetical protein